MQPQIRAGLLVNFRPTVEALGGDIDAVLARAEQPSDVLVNPEHYVPYTSYLRLLDSAAILTGCPHFGLEMSRELGAENMGVVGFIITQASSVGEAWASLKRFYHVHDTYGVVVVTESAGLACIRYEIPRSKVSGARQSLDVAAGVSTNIHRMLCGGDSDLVSLHFPYPEPDDLSAYEFLGCRNIHFGKPGYAMFFPTEVLQLPVAHSDPQIKFILDQYLESLELSSQHATSRQVEKLIRGFLSTGDCTLVHVARFLSMSVRSLQNHLEAEHTSFQLLLDKVRRELALHHLSRGDMQFTQLAYLLGYSELSAFSRSFKRWYNTSPRNWQRLQLLSSIAQGSDSA
jgi:AraC-like DNA-binding protein